MYHIHIEYKDRTMDEPDLMSFSGTARAHVHGIARKASEQLEGMADILSITEVTQEQGEREITL